MLHPCYFYASDAKNGLGFPICFRFGCFFRLWLLFCCFASGSLNARTFASGWQRWTMASGSRNGELGCGRLSFSVCCLVLLNGFLVSFLFGCLFRFVCLCARRRLFKGCLVCLFRFVTVVSWFTVSGWRSVFVLVCRLCCVCCLGFG